MEKKKLNEILGYILPVDNRVWGLGEPGNRPCIMPDDAAPNNWDDPFLCRTKAVKGIRFAGAQKAMALCEYHLNEMKDTLTKSGDQFSIEEVE